MKNIQLICTTFIFFVMPLNAMVRFRALNLPIICKMSQKVRFQADKQPLVADTEKLDSKEPLLKKLKKYSFRSMMGLGGMIGAYELLGSDPDDQKDCNIQKFVSPDMAQKIEEQRQKFHDKGYQVFYHARSSNSHFVNDIWNGICALEQNKPIIFDHISLRFRDGKEDVQLLKQHRQNLLKQGACRCMETIHGIPLTFKESELIFMNKKISQHDTCLTQGECTGYYFKNNTSSASFHGCHLLEKLLKQHELFHYFTKYEKELEDLSMLHQSCFKTGELLVIAIDKDYVDEMVYTSGRWGVKSVLPKSKTLKKYKELMNKVMPILCIQMPREYWFGQFGVRNFCFAVPDMPGEYGAKEQGGKYFITSWHDVDFEKYEAYKKARDCFFQKIVADRI